MENQREDQSEMAFDAHWQAGTDQQSFDRNHRQKPAQESELMCACTGGKCEGICRTEHLHRERSAKPKSKEKINSAIRTSWTNPPNTCSESYPEN